jgi:hypothetical protein
MRWTNPRLAAGGDQSLPFALFAANETPFRYAMRKSARH